MSKGKDRQETCLVEELLRAIDGQRSSFMANSKYSELLRVLEDLANDSPYDLKCLESFDSYTRYLLEKDYALWRKICYVSDYARIIYNKLKGSSFTYDAHEYVSALVEAVYTLVILGGGVRVLWNMVLIW
jgi:hypothetical protein